MVETLRKLLSDFELMVFTASAPEYANKIIDAIDPKNEIFSFRLFRQHCYQTEKGLYIKDLRIINRNPKEMVLVDNATYSFGFQLSNGIPIIPFYGDKSDAEMMFLYEYLHYLLDKPDMRKINKKIFKFHLYGDGLTFDELRTKIFKN